MTPQPKPLVKQATDETAREAVVELFQEILDAWTGDLNFSGPDAIYHKIVCEEYVRRLNELLEDIPTGPDLKEALEDMEDALARVGFALEEARAGIKMKKGRGR